VLKVLEFLCTSPGCDISRTKSRGDIAAIVIAFLAGSIAAFQAFISGALTSAIDDSLWAGLISNIGALLIVSLFLISFNFRKDLKLVFKNLKSGDISVWLLLGGLFGAVYVATSAFSVAALGTGLFTIGVVASANLTSLAVDRSGFGSTKKYSINFKRVFAALLAVLAVALAGFTPNEKISLLSLLVVLLAGISQVFQLAFNSKLASKSSSQVSAFINFPVAIFFGLVFVLVLHLFNRPWPQFPSQIWLYSAGPLGALFVLVAAWLVKKIGVLVFTLATISGQLITALFIDIGFTEINVGWQLISGAVLVLVAVYLASELR
jgi:bacterial/archaeal transporter family-2 protein